MTSTEAMSFQLDARYEFDAPQYVDFSALDMPSDEDWFEHQHHTTPLKTGKSSLLLSPMSNSAFVGSGSSSSNNLVDSLGRLTLSTKKKITSTPRLGGSSNGNAHPSISSQILVSKSR
jgi:hypothetical protein